MWPSRFATKRQVRIRLVNCPWASKILTPPPLSTSRTMRSFNLTEAAWLGPIMLFKVLKEVSSEEPMTTILKTCSREWSVRTVPPNPKWKSLTNSKYAALRTRKSKAWCRTKTTERLKTLREERIALLVTRWGLTRRRSRRTWWPSTTN